jgi:hypothetical protein
VSLARLPTIEDLARGKGSKISDDELALLVFEISLQRHDRKVKCVRRRLAEILGTSESVVKGRVERAKSHGKIPRYDVRFLREVGP